MPWRRYEDIKMDFEYIEYEGLKLIHMAQNRI
jgi:hypothetical protein